MKETLLKFKYETRPSSTDFIKCLINEHWEINPKPSDSIKDQFWYSVTWGQDPTVSGMLEMLDEIHLQYTGNDLWESLITGQKITFNILKMENFGLSHDLYIKMNSRGKPLTNFENLKAQLFDLLKQGSEIFIEVNRVENSFDNEWTDLF